jgi:hypothetical protein
MPIAAAVPAVGEALLPFLPDDEGVVRAVAIGLAVVLPLVVGVLTAMVANQQRSGRPLPLRLLMGYVYAPVVGLLVVALVVVVPVVKASYLLRQFELKHIAIMIGAGSYDDVLDDVEQALRRHGLQVERHRAHKVIRQLFSWMTWVQEHIFCKAMARDMVILRGELPDAGWFEVTVHATDISILGQKRETTHVYAILAEELSEERLHFAWDDEAQALEDRIRDAQRRLADGDDVPVDEIASMVDELRELSLESEEWNAIRRQLYGLEIDHYKQRVGADR